MAMKLDKETVIKHRFWFLLPVFAICLLVGWICVLGVRGETAKNYTTARERDNALKNISSQQELKNQSWIDAMIKELEVSSAKKNELWYKEFDRQNKVVRDTKDRNQYRIMQPFFTWPERTRAQWMKTSQGRDLYNMDFGEYLGNVPSDEYREEYLGQFEGIVDLVKDWLNETNPNNPLGAVRVYGGKDDHRRYVIPQLLKPYNLLKEKHVLSDEIHLLQEDVAVKREIMASLADLLDSYSKLKHEWNEVPFDDIKAASAPVAVSTSSNPADGQAAANPTIAAPVATTDNAPVVPAARESSPEIYQKVRFYNYIWPNLLNTAEIAQNAKLKPTTVEFGLPVVDPYKGWRLDLQVGQDPQDDKKLILHIVSANHSSLHSLPVMPLMVWYSELGSELESNQPLFVSDAGGVGPSEYWPNATIKKISEKKLKEIPLPANFGKITRVTRVLPENAIDQQVVFNNDWLVNLQLTRRANTPTLTLRGEVINRSGRRLPVSTFTAGLTLPNSTNLLQEEFKIPVDAFNAGERRTFAQEIKNPIQPRTIAIVRQKLNWRSTPIKRIDRLEIGEVAHQQSDRLKILPLKAYDFKTKDPLNQNISTTPVDPAAGGEQAGEATAGGFGALGMGGGNKLGTGGAAGNVFSPNQGIPLKRYVEVSSQLRRMPVALVMVVDATAITDVIAAMSNSRLRFQVTMAPWTKIQNLGRPGTAEATASASTAGQPSSRGAEALASGGSSMLAKGGRFGPGTSGGSGGGTGAPGLIGSGDGPPAGGIQGGGIGGRQGPGAGTAGGQKPTVVSMGFEDDSSVVELQIYGIITVYESPDHARRIEQQKANAPAAAPTTPPAQ
ncbi:MAG: hypothetical protein JNJ77_14915 [Planctomycetia bacterium]|nr:hypothetical protein [Planctomycetia bacterium]